MTKTAGLDVPRPAGYYWKDDTTLTKGYLITFDANGGSVTPASAGTDADGKLTEALPTPTPSGSYRFDGWFTAADGGDAVTTETVFTEDTTIYAHWTYTGGSGGSSRPSYPITVPEVENGTVETDSERAKSGRPVTITVTPDEGYALDTLTVLDKNGDPVEVTKNEDGTYTFKMPAGKVDIQASFVALKLPFVDVSESDWFYDSVWYAYFHGLMTGTAADRFSPYLTTTRGMMATILYRLEGEPSVAGLETPFTDLTQDWYRDAVIWAAAHDIVLGYGDGTYGPEDPVTREQLVTILYRFVDTPTGSADLSDFVDSDQVSPYAQYPMSWAVATGLIQGDDQHRLNPGNPATRAEMAAILTRFCEAMN